MFSTIESITTIPLAHFILGDAIDVFQIYGMRLIVAGIVLPNLALIRQAAPDNEKRQKNACG
jgi:multidrug transporter EmrE-like cation transporter